MCIGRLFGTFIDDRIKEIDHAATVNRGAMYSMLEYYCTSHKTTVVHGQKHNFMYTVIPLPEIAPKHLSDEMRYHLLITHPVSHFFVD